MPTKVIRSYFLHLEYQIFLDDADRVDMIVKFQLGKPVGEVITWAELPWELRDQYEQFINPQV